MGCFVNATRWLPYPREIDPVPAVQEAGWAPRPGGQLRKILSPPEFDPRTVHPLVSRYIDWANPAHTHFPDNSESRQFLLSTNI